MRDSADIATRDIETGAFLVGYARVPATDQDPAMQVAQLRATGCGRIFADRVGATRRAHPQLVAMFKYLEPGDIVVVTRLSQLAGSIRELLDIAGRIRETGAGLRSLAEPWVDAPTGGGALAVFAGIVGFERSLVAERTSAGRTAAMKRGTKVGRKPALDPAQLDHMYRLVDEGNTSMQEIATLFSIHRSTLFRLMSRRAAKVR
ncbi:recombinase family protein [Paraburkholderia sp. BR10872]|uniref:recombinase family protein n=1 Tax=Paraburkholderia sp. BR10872 TaxID=3236989 RepID=UPI0034D28DE0